MLSTLLPHGFHIREHTIDVPWDRADASLGTLELFARELYTDPDAPALAYFQGGPGNPGPRMLMGWIPEALKHYRVILIDERGTGRSTRIDATQSSLVDVAHLSRLRPPDIVADAEDFRRHLGIERWDVLGNSFGGICVGAYLSYFPESVGRAMFTGVVPPFDTTPDEYNMQGLDAMAERMQRFYSQVPWAQSRVREVCAHLASHEEYLPTGERLTPERFRFIGVRLGEETGADSLAMLLEEPFHRGKAELRLRTDFLAAVGATVSLAPNPLWAVIHEQIFAGLTEDATSWSAARVYEQFPGFSLTSDPSDASEPFYLFGNAFFPFHFEQDPALRPFRTAVDEISQMAHVQPSVDAAALRSNVTPAAVLLYEDDLYVPFEYAIRQADQIPNLAVTTHPTYQHDGIYLHGAEVFRQVHAALPPKGA